MILLPVHKYSVLEEQIKEVQRNVLFARSVVEKHLSGIIYVDNVNEPRTSLIAHPYGMLLLMGDSNNIEFNDRFKSYAFNTAKIRAKHEWLITSSPEWDNVLTDLFGGSLIKTPENSGKEASGTIELNGRQNFSFNVQKYAQFEKRTIPEHDLIVKTDAVLFEQMTGSVIPQKFWDNAKDFETNGSGYTLLHNGEIAATAFSAFVHENRLEIGIETVEKYRGNGYAELVCCKLIDECLESGLVPVWSCRSENTASVRLDGKLGFETTLSFPFYRLSD
ncbi:MAG: GNAT family N-acetyltransferase [Paludibacter sp.]|nr:GNAT family N-acetyltransferase [Paludibacter sp.]